MSIRMRIKRNKIFSAITIIFIIWITILVLIAIFCDREVIFYDALKQKDVSSEYNSRLPLTRYFIEPIFAIALILSNSYDFIIGLFIIFLVFRTIFILGKKKGMIKSEKSKLLSYPFKDFIRFSALVLSISVFSALIFILLLYTFTGIFYVNLHFMLIIQLLIPICFVLIAIKAAIIFFKFYHPHLKFNYMYKKRNQIPDNPTKSYRVMRIFRRESIYFLGISLLLLGTNVLLISTLFPTQKIEVVLDDDEILLDLHVHTTYSDGWLSPEERVLWYIEQGIHVAAFSDHDNLRGARAAEEFVKKNGLDFLVIIAEEWTDHENNIHMNIFNLNETIVPLESKVDSGPKAMDAKDTIKYVKKHGAYITVNHYNYNDNGSGGFGTPYSLEMLWRWGVDGFEIVNGGGVRDEKIREFCLNHSLICMSATDMHTNAELNSFVKLRLDDPDNKTVDNIFRNLRRNDHQAIAIFFQPNRVDFPDILNDLGFGIIEDAYNYFINIDSYQALSWIIWSSITYVFIALIYRKIKKINIEDLRVKIL